MEHLNYCRQLLKRSKTALSKAPAKSPAEKAAQAVIDLCNKSQKFLLPFDGKIIDDEALRALDDSMPLQLPYPVIALEFKGEAATPQEAKRIVFCVEGKDDVLVIPMASWGGQDWVKSTPISVKKVGYLDRTARDTGFYARAVNNNNDGLASSDVMVLLSLCNALACSNVQTELSAPKRGAKIVKSAFPFDSYHVLTITTSGKHGEASAASSHRYPREHLRRGHIRRLADGRRIWVNATVVVAGRGSGFVSKDYRIAA